MSKIKHYLKQWSRKRYSILIVPHHLAGAKTIEMGLPVIALFLTVWTLLSAGGILAFVKGGELAVHLGENKLLNARMRVAARDVEAMRETARGVTMLERDLKHLLGYEDPSNIALAAAGVAQKRPRQDTVQELLMGRVSDSTLESLQAEKKRLRRDSQLLMAWAGSFFLDHNNAARRASAQPNEWPSVGVLTSGFGVRLSPFHRQGSGGEVHRGVDIANAAGTPVKAAADGVVRKAGWMSGYGRTVVLDHGFGYSSLYGHTSEILVAEGSYIRRGDTIAYMGTTGRSTGNHLHFEVWQYGRPINPFQLVKLNKLIDARESYAQSPVEPEDALGILGIGTGGQ